MKKMISIFSVFLLLCCAFIPINAQYPETEIEPTAVVECSHYNGKHRMYFVGTVNIYGSNNIIRYSNWNFYRCACNSAIICNGTPPSTNVGSYFETYYSGNLSAYYAYVTDAAPYYSGSNFLQFASFFN